MFGVLTRSQQRNMTYLKTFSRNSGTVLFSIWSVVLLTMLCQMNGLQDKLRTVTCLGMDKEVVYYEFRLILQIKGTIERVWYRSYLRARLSGVRIPTGTKDLLLQNHPVLLRRPPCFLLNGNQRSFLVLKGLRVVKNSWNCTSLLPIYLNFMDTDSCTFTFTSKGRLNHTAVNFARGNAI